MEEIFYSITARKLEDIGRYSTCLLKNGVIYKVSGERQTSHSIYYLFIFKTTEETYEKILTELGIKRRKQ